MNETQLHEPIQPGQPGVPYFEAVRGPNGTWNWAQCPRCGAIVPNAGNRGPARHWVAASQAEAIPEGEARALDGNR